MSEKTFKKMRKELKKMGKFDIHAKADHRIAVTVDKVIYVKNILGETKATPVKRNVIVNATKVQYRRLKKLMQKGELNGTNK